MGEIQMTYAKYTAQCEALSQFPLSDSCIVMITHFKHESWT